MSAPVPELGEVELAVLDILRREHQHWYAAIRREDLLDILNAKLRPELDLFAGHGDIPEDRGPICDRAMRQARANLVMNDFPCWSCQTGYFYGVDAKDEEMAKSGILAKFLSLQKELGDITKSAEAEHQRRTVGHVRHQEAIPLPVSGNGERNAVVSGYNGVGGGCGGR